jgi:hypothetical protein
LNAELGAGRAAQKAASRSISQNMAVPPIA